MKFTEKTAEGLGEPTDRQMASVSVKACSRGILSGFKLRVRKYGQSRPLSRTGSSILLLDMLNKNVVRIFLLSGFQYACIPQTHNLTFNPNIEGAAKRCAPWAPRGPSYVAPRSADPDS